MSTANYQSRWIKYLIEEPDQMSIKDMKGGKYIPQISGSLASN